MFDQQRENIDNEPNDIKSNFEKFSLWLDGKEKKILLKLHIICTFANLIVFDTFLCILTWILECLTEKRSAWMDNQIRDRAQFRIEMFRSNLINDNAIERRTHSSQLNQSESIIANK